MSDNHEPQQEPKDRSAPEGSFCQQHPETPALATCPRCGKHACMVCWQPAVDRCDSCLRRDPTEAAPPIPFEQTELGLGARLFGTIATAWSPVRSAPAMGRDELGPATIFALLTFLPLSAVTGIIPYTKTLLFKGVFQVVVKGTPTTTEIALDVARASAIGLALAVIQWLVFAAPYVSLVRAYGDPKRRNVPLRAMLYRAFLIPAQPMLLNLLVWALVFRDPTPAQAAFLLLASLVPTVLMLATMWSVARLASGVGPMLSFLVVIIPITLWEQVGELLQHWLVKLLPPPPGL